MTYRITHSIQYHYDPAVELAPHDIRLQPRTDSFQTLKDFTLEIDPQPLGQTLTLDAMGNLVTRCWWPPIPMASLLVTAHATVETHCENPFDYLLEPWANQLPLDYPRSQYDSLSLYLNDSKPLFLSSAPISAWAQSLLCECDFRVTDFLFRLTQEIYEGYTYQQREEGAPYPPTITYQTKQGSCRDFVLLFMSACHAVELASRFVSGYEEGSPDHEQTLHAWVEVYLPGAGWRGYDPTLGLAVGDRHIALAAHRFPDLTAPISGRYRGQTQSIMCPEVSIRRIEDQEG